MRARRSVMLSSRGLNPGRGDAGPDPRVWIWGRAGVGKTAGAVKPTGGRSGATAWRCVAMPSPAAARLQPGWPDSDGLRAAAGAASSRDRVTSVKGRSRRTTRGSSAARMGPVELHHHALDLRIVRGLDQQGSGRNGQDGAQTQQSELAEIRAISISPPAIGKRIITLRNSPYTFARPASW